MLKDSNNDPPLLNVASNAPCFGANPPFPNSPNNANSINPSTINLSQSPVESAKISGKTSRSSHKVVTPLRKQNSSFLVASLESGISEQIAKITTSTNFKSPASNLASSFASLCTFESLTDPTLLQSHVQRSLENSAIGLESPYQQIGALSTCPMSSNISRSNNINNTSNSLYNTPIRCKQSRSHDFSELPSQQRIKKRRSSLLAHEEIGDLTSLLGGPESLSDLSHFKDNESDEVNDLANVITNSCEERQTEMTGNSCDDEDNYFDEDKSKKMKSSQSTQFNLPSTEEYQDGNKPPFSYASLIAQAIISSPRQRLALSNIYSWIMDTYPYYKSQTCGWQNSIRHNLSLNKCFKKIPRENDEPGKGAYWTVDLDEMDDFEDGMFKRRRTSTSNNNANNSESTCNSYFDSPKCNNNNAFLHGTDWSPLTNYNNTKTPNKMMSAIKSSVVCSSVPMTPLTMSQNHFKTPQKHQHSNELESHVNSTTVLTPKVVSTNSPYTSLNLNNSPSAGSTSSSATFWSYPNLSLSQLGLDADPPLPESDTSATFYNIFNCDTLQQEPNNKLPELFQGSTCINTNNIKIGITTEKEIMRMSPLSWILSISSQDTSLGLFDQSQQILSEYLSLSQQ